MAINKALYSSAPFPYAVVIFDGRQQAKGLHVTAIERS